MIAPLVDRMQEARMPLLVFATLASVPAVTALLSLSLLPVVVDTALDGVDERVVGVAIAGVRTVTLAIVACGFITAFGGAMFMRSFLRASIDRIRAATEAIAAGDFSHRVDSPRHDELGSLAVAIDGAALRLERLERSRRQMLACVSHELRTPVTIVRSAAFTLARHEADPVRGARFQMIDDELARLASLVDDLVEAASIHAGGVRLHRERVNLLEELDEAVCRFRESADRRGVGIVVSVIGPRRRRVSADLDVDRVQQIVGNLLANAVRHAWADTTIELAVDPASSEGDLHRVDVINRGDCIPHELRERVFEPFEQHGNRTGRVGLGLAIARDLAEAHGGSLILVEAGAADTVRFRIELPSAPERSRGDRLRSEQSVIGGGATPASLRWCDTEFAT